MLMCAAGCTDDLDTGINANETEGHDTKITLCVAAPEMNRLESRADMDDEDAYKVESIWVGIYNFSTGKSTITDYDGNGLFLDTNDKDHGFTTNNKAHDTNTLTDIKTKSGRSYIVAVANPDRNTGYKMNSDGSIGAETSLLELLKGASTWNKFKSIVISRPLLQGSADIFMPNATLNPLVMSGTYSETGLNNDGTIDWNNIEPVYIDIATDGVKLNGAIHLRRPYSQIKFNIERAADTEIVDFEVQSYVVHNVPTYGWLFERKQSATPSNPWEYANAGDPMQTDATKNENYRSSLTYTSADINGSDNKYSFDFWQMENKRTGILAEADARNYQKRELEWENGGVYKSLCPTSTPTLNNFAGFVEINAKLTYKDPENNPGNPTIPDETFPSVTSREVTAKYIVHLGYIGGDANDFNSLRNAIYTYNVKIKSASEIIVEAFTNQENQPGAEGTVIDVTDKMFNLDAHYGAFNIKLTQTELQNFSFSILADNYSFAIGEDGNPTTNSNPIPAAGDPTYPYYSWIELTPTTDENVLAPYPGIGSNKLYKLKEIRDNASTLPEGWYTVFINEYTYEDESDGNRGNETGRKWVNYVNKPNRMAYLNVAQHVSADGKSSYYRSKYAVSQRSIQTYYDTDNSTTTALGVEHINETFGMDLRWPDLSNYNQLSADNGRYNVWIYSGGGNGNWTTAGNWTDYVQCGNESGNTNGVPNKVNEINNTNQLVPEADKAAKTWPVPMPVLLDADAFTGDDKSAEARINEYDPQTTQATAQVIHALYACMNRNRDLNGNGKIDANELRWYLPASGKYARVIMGRNSLSTPIMDYANTTRLGFAPSSGYNGRLSLASSDGKTIWVVEGMSMSDFGVYHVPSWSVRCIRNLGVNLRTVTSDPTNDPVNPAYTVDKGTDTYSTGAAVKISHYYGTSLRDYSSEPLPLHKTNSDYNKLGRYGFEVALRGNSVTTPQGSEATASYESATVYTNYINNATSCESLNTSSGRTGWRTPNQKELVIMRRAGLLPFNQAEENKNFQSCTVEYYQNTPPFNSPANIDLNNGYQRICTVRKDAATAQYFGNCSMVRCVRDLTAAEASMTYDQIRVYKQP